MKLRPVKVEWVDAESSTRWKVIDEHCKDKPAIITTVGFQLQRDKKRIRVALSIDNNGFASDVITIPRGCIKRIGRP